MKTKISDLIISGILKRGILWEAKAFETDVEVPIETSAEEGAPKEKKITIKIRCENMTVRIDKEE